ncbi:MAG: site-specific DNA-methyltransferase [Firmicutes bacterium]|nr:site-specific DNA-methyltransferase [Bacillota bacterium]
MSRKMFNYGYYNIDCMEGMKEFPDKYFDLAVIDPPYGIGESGEKNKSRACLATAKDYAPYSGGDRNAPPFEYFNELRRVSCNQIIFGANHFISRIPVDSSCWIVWDKENGQNDFADCELAWTSFKTAVRIFRFRWQGMLQGDMKNKEKRIHPNQKPVKLYEWILQKYANRGDIILDTHVGSASSLIACHRMGFKFVGFEKDEHYYEVSKKRLDNEISETQLRFL